MGISRPAPEDFTSGAVRKAVLKESAQHPVTILPIALGVAGMLGTLITREPFILALTLGLLSLGAGSWVWNYFGRGEHLAEQYIQRLRTEVTRHEEMRRNALLGRVEALGWETGAGRFHDLIRTHSGARTMLSGRSDSSRFEMLADQALAEGVKLLERGIQLGEALESVNSTELEEEIAVWTRDHKRCKTERECAAIQDKINANKRTLEILERRRETLAEIEARLNGIANALDQLNLTAPMETVDGSTSEVGAASQLEEAVRAAITVEERLRKLDAPSDMDLEARNATRVGGATESR